MIAIVPALWGAAALTLEVYGRRGIGGDERWDAAVVLGCRVFPDGRPSTALRCRVLRAVELYQRGIVRSIVCTGGVGEGVVSEASAEAELARRCGVPESALIAEHRSRTTEENARYAAQVAAGVRRVVVVTDAYHVFRSERVFGRYFERVRGVGSVGPHRWARFRGALREVAVLLYYAARGRLRANPPPCSP